MPAKEAIGFIGLGVMGAPMARRLLDAGYPLTVYNRTSQKAAALQAAGATLAATPRQLAQRASVIFTMVRDDAALHAVTDGTDGAFAGARPGTVFFDCSTTAPQTAREQTAHAATLQCAWLDAPVLGGPAAAAGGTLPFVVGGPREVLERHRGILEVLGKPILWLGESGMGAAAKLAHNLACGIVLEACSEAIIFGHQLGLSRAQVLEVLAAGALKGPLLDAKTPKWINDDFTASFALSLMGKDLALASDAARAAGIALPALELTNRLYALGEQAGLGRLDSSAILHIVQQVAAHTHELPPSQPAR